jgi:uncharacterized protein (DUF2126 family)
MEDMQRAGYAFDAAWFAPHFEFRFPKIGEIAARGMHGAAQRAGALARDGRGGRRRRHGALRRFVAGAHRGQGQRPGGPRHRVTVNGVTLPLQPTGRVGEYVAGVRYRAWQPPSALHPTIGVHAPLTFDLVDTWAQRSLGGCRTTWPIRAGATTDLPGQRLRGREPPPGALLPGHTPGQMVVAEAERSLEFPFTLDLRRAGR